MIDEAKVSARPALLPGVLAGLVLAAGLWFLQVLGEVGALQDLLLPRGAPTFLQNVLGSDFTFFPYDLGMLTDRLWIFLSAVIATAVIVVVTAAVVGIAGRDLRASGGLGFFALGWFACCLGCVAGFAADVLVRAVLHPGPDLAQTIAPLGLALRIGGAWGMTYGWIPALVALVVWVLGRPRDGDAPLGEPRAA